MRKIANFICVLFLGNALMAQTTVAGIVTEKSSGEPIPGAYVKLVGESVGTTTDFDGNFSLELSQEPPFTLELSSIGYSLEKVEITQSNQLVSVALKEQTTALDEVVVSASRTPERIFESSVTVEKMGAAEIRNTTSNSFYGGIEGLKGVQVNNGGILLKQISTRGFSTVYNEGFLQLVDMMDNSAPGLNFPAGNLVGINDLDVQSVELMPGAASALYGANAIKGILFMNSKNPFNHQGISAYVKRGITSQEAAGDKPFTDLGIRMAYAFSDKFAAKATFSVIDATDWHAVNYTDINDPNKSASAIDYDGINIYGEQSSSLNTVFLGGLMANPATQPYVGLASSNPNYFGATPVLSTGYKEVDLMDGYNAKSIKFNAALHYKISEDMELSWNSKFGSGNTILHATNRNVLKDFALQQHKLELNGKQFNLRAYASLEDSGKTHDASALAGRIANAQPGGIATGWYGTYLQTYLGVIAQQIAAVPVLGPALAAQPGFPVTAILAHQGNQLAAYGFPASAGMSINDLPGVDTNAAHSAARAGANANMLVPGSPEFKAAYEAAISKPIAEGGAAIQDQSKSYSFEGDYNLSEVVDFADIIVGASYRMFSLDSHGTLFTDYDQPIEYGEYGVYGQMVKNIGFAKFTGSLRYDKSEFFEGSFTPRLGLLFNLSEDQNIRVSYQTGFRNPSAQDQYIGLDVGSAVLMGSSPDNVERFSMNLLGNDGQTYTVTGNQVFNNSFSLSSVLAGAPAPSSLNNVRPEKVNSFEFGYRLNKGRLNVDFNGYFSEYQDFLAGQNVVVPLDGNPASLATGKFRVFQVDGNTDNVVKTYGMNLGINTRIFDKWKIGLVYEYNQMDFDQASDPDYEAGFNTPENRVKLSLATSEIVKNLGFGLNVRWNDEYMYESTFLDAMIPSNTVLDAQANYSIPSIKSTVKVGVTNLFGDDYMQIPGSGMIGQQSYVSWTINP
ncbi:MAG: TonB-dependent receptor [Lutibacter sp.]|nr:TonB-dependent receptor [Lutibacter sp.]